AVVTGEPGQQQTGHEKARSEDGRRARQEVGGTAAGHETSAASHAKATAFGFLQQHHRDQNRDDHEVNDYNDSLHLYLPSQTIKTATPAVPWACGVLNWRGVTRSGGAVSPFTPPCFS